MPVRRSQTNEVSIPSCNLRQRLHYYKTTVLHYYLGLYRAPASTACPSIIPISSGIVTWGLAFT